MFGIPRYEARDAVIQLLLVRELLVKIAYHKVIRILHQSSVTRREGVGHREN